MMWPPTYSLVIQLPVATLDLGKRQRSRIIRRKNRYGRQDVWSKYRGELSPKELRESGL